MGGFRFDWRWVALIAVVAILVNARSLPWPVLALTFAASGGYVLYLGWQVWNGGSTLPGSRVTYWRGQRIEVRPQQRRISMPSLRTIGPAVLYLVVGAGLLLAALAVVLRQLE